MKTVILNSTNIVPSTGNSKLTYRFPSGGIKLTEENQICITNLNIFYSWFNFNQNLYNNTLFTYTWIDGTTHNVLIPDSNLNLTDLNAYFRSVMVSNNHYLISGSNQVFYLELTLNVSKYAVQFNALTVPTSGQATTLGLTQPVGATWAFPVSVITPQINILTTNNFNKVIGFNAGTYPILPSVTNYSKLSDFSPQVSPITSLIVTCSLVDNDIAIPNELIYCFPIPESDFGSLLSPQINEFSFIQAKTGYFSTISVEFRDQNFNQVEINDPSIVILLGIRNKKDLL